MYCLYLEAPFAQPCWITLEFHLVQHPASYRSITQADTAGKPQEESMKAVALGVALALLGNNSLLCVDLGDLSAGWINQGKGGCNPENFISHSRRGN